MKIGDAHGDERTQCLTRNTSPNIGEIREIRGWIIGLWDRSSVAT